MNVSRILGNPPTKTVGGTLVHETSKFLEAYGFVTLGEVIQEIRAKMAADRLADGTKQIYLSKEQYEELQKLLRAFYQKTKCGAVILVDISGLMITQAGTFDEGVKALLSTLSAGNYAATNEIARLLGQEQGFKGNFLEGDGQNYYLTGVDESRLLVVVFGDYVTFGMLRVLIGKLSEQLLPILKMPVQGELVELAKKEVDNDEFREELSSRLSEVLFFKPQG